MRSLMVRMTMLLAVGSFAACVSTSEVVPMGKDSYMISVDDSLTWNKGNSAITASKAANAYCERMGKHMIVRRMDTSGTPGWTTLSANFIFSCVTEDDPEYQRPNLKKDPNTVIEDARH